MGYPEHLLEVVAEDMGVDLYADDDCDSKCWECQHNKQYKDCSEEDIAACKTCKDFSNFKEDTAMNSQCVNDRDEKDIIPCPICGGYIEINAMQERGSCDTCDATYVDGHIEQEEEIEIGSDIH